MPNMWDKRDDTVVHEKEPFNAEPLPGVLDGQNVTPTDTFFSRNHGAIPQLDPQSWRLQVGGRVRQPLTLSLGELRSGFGQQTLTVTMQCAGNRRDGLIKVRDIPGEHPWSRCAIGTASWSGALLADVLAAAGVQPDAAHVAFEASDVAEDAKPAQPYGGSIPMSKALGGDVLLAWEMNGQPLTPVHGAPVRVVVPGYIGARSVKWVESVTAQAEPSENYFQSTAYHVLPATAKPVESGQEHGISLGPVGLNCEILQPGDGDAVPPGQVAVSGYAYVGGDRTVMRVDVSADSGRTWQEAELADQPSPWTWRLWHAALTVPSGPVQILARAWDDTGATHPESPEHLWNPKGYVNNSWGRVQIRAT